MDQHPVPRQITTFEFKLIGFLTLKQFIYLVVFVPLGFIAVKLFPIPYINLFVGVLVAGVGVAFAFVPVNDRPMEVWVRNLLKRLTSATQYEYHKHNPPSFLVEDLFFVEDPHRVLAHVESQEKLAAYLAKTKGTLKPNTKKANISFLLSKPNEVLVQKKTPQQSIQTSTVIPKTQTASQPQSIPQPGIKKNAFFAGTVKNNKLIPLPGILIYVKDEKGNTVRLLKTNPHGVFATFNKLPSGDYTFELKDPKGGYFFDTMKINTVNISQKTLEFHSKELL